MNIPAPQQNFAPTYSTATVLQPQPDASKQGFGNGPTTLNLGAVTPRPSQYEGRRSSEHPPGYQQNIYAQDLSPAQRSSLDEQTRRESLDEGSSAGETAGNMWNAVKGWANAAGKSLADTEEQVWKKINGHWSEPNLDGTLFLKILLWL
jgi:hypothetical protein